MCIQYLSKISQLLPVTNAHHERDAMRLAPLTKRIKSPVIYAGFTGTELLEGSVPPGYRASISVWCRLVSDAVYGNPSQNCYQAFRYQKNMEDLFIRFFKQGLFDLDTRGPYKCYAFSLR